MIYNVDKIKIQFMLDYKDDIYWIPQTYLNYSPVLKPNTPSLRTISIEKKHPVCYVKLDDQWVYYIDNKLFFSPLIKDPKQLYGFIPNRIPCVFYVGYIDDDGLFFLYINTKFGTKNFLFFTYNDTTKQISLTPNRQNATQFKFNQIQWKQYVNETRIIPIINKSKNITNNK